MKKMMNWIKNHLPTKRRLIQLYAALLHNANLKGYVTGSIYTGPVKSICSPGLNCYSCPAASGACPLGALQNALSATSHRAPYYMFGIIALYGLIFGRWICGFLCPFGFIQELLHKIPTPKLKKNRVTRVLSYFKYVVLVFFVGILPLAYAFRDFPLPGFCKYICPAGTLEGAMGLLSNKVNEGYFRMLGPLFTWKFLLMVSILVACVFIFRAFCRFLCPLGALYGFFNRIALVGVKVVPHQCTNCGLCIGKCKMDTRRVGDHECIQCGECISACPTGAITWKGGKFFLAPNAVAPTATEEEKKTNARVAKRNKIVRVTALVLALSLLVGALVYYNFIDGRVEEPPVEDTPPVTGGNGGGEVDPTPKPPVGVKVGNTCPAITLDVAGSDVDFRLSDYAGRVVVLNFWYTSCGPCLEELPHFYEVAKELGEDVQIVTIHREEPAQSAEGVAAWIAVDHAEWNDGTMLVTYDAGKTYQNMFSVQAFPVTVVINADGVITAQYVGSVSKAELLSAISAAK